MYHHQLPRVLLSLLSGFTLAAGLTSCHKNGGNSGPAPDPHEYIVTTFAGSGIADFADGTGTAAAFQYPVGLAMDTSGNIYVGDGANNRIRKITPGAVVTTIAGAGARGYKDGSAVASLFNFALGIVLDGDGNMYVADEENNMIRKIAPSGEVSTLAGDTTAGYKDASGKDARFNAPWGMAMDQAGTIYVADAANHLIRKVTLSGVVTTLAGNGKPGFKDDAGTAAQFNDPIAVAVDASGNVYVADETNNAIRKITPAGVVTTVAGGPDPAYKDGSAKEARFFRPIGIATDASDNLFIADYGNQRIRKITPAGTVTTIAGDGSTFFKDGPATRAEFKYPSGIVVDRHTGNIYIADMGNSRIRLLKKL
jgi:sugar lactone lactonase YvrE